MPYATLKSEAIGERAFLVVTEISDSRSDDTAVYCGASVAVGDVYVGGGFLSRAAVEIGKPVRSVADARAERIVAVEDIARRLRASVAGSDSSKRDVYSIKYEVAVKALAGDAASLALLTPEAAARGETAVELATLVKTLGDQWREAGLAIDAAYQGHKAALLMLDSIEAIDAYDVDAGWPF